MPFAIFLIIISIGISLQVEFGYGVNKYAEKDTIENYNPITQSFSNTDYNAPSLHREKSTRLSTLATSNNQPLSFSEQDAEGHTEMIETILTRICRTVNILAHQNNCVDPDDESFTWAFLPVVSAANKTGLLTDAYNMVYSSTYSCATRDSGEYGRWLLRQSLPDGYIINKGYAYDLTGIGISAIGRTDPCGFSNLLSN